MEIDRSRLLSAQLRATRLHAEWRGLVERVAALRMDKTEAQQQRGQLERAWKRGGARIVDNSAPMVVEGYIGKTVRRTDMSEHMAGDLQAIDRRIAELTEAIAQIQALASAAGAKSGEQAALVRRLEEYAGGPVGVLHRPSTRAVLAG
jgi:hypothetical protein